VNFAPGNNRPDCRYLGDAFPANNHAVRKSALQALDVSTKTGGGGVGRLPCIPDEQRRNRKSRHQGFDPQSGTQHEFGQASNSVGADPSELMVYRLNGAPSADAPLKTILLPLGE